ncbi:MAG: collagen-like protein [Rickettsiales bacterium]|jgi:hypothetical protein|nr:collagen-like protein [Rickettsiales bacterium]
MKKLVSFIAISAAFAGAALAAPTISKARSATNSSARLSIGSYIKDKATTAGKTLVVNGGKNNSNSPGTSGGGDIPAGLADWKDWADNLLRDLPGHYATKDELSDALANVNVDLTGYATETYVDDAIAALSLNGMQGKQVVMQNDGTNIQWKYQSDSAWQNLIALSALRGPQGQDGQDGAPGATGPEGPQGRDGVEGPRGADGKSAYQSWLDNGHTGTEAEFIASFGQNGAPGQDGNDGAPGADGADGREILLTNDGTNIKWQYDGDANWNNLVAVADLVGAAGAPGAEGQPGTPGAPGQDGAAGADGKNIQLQVAAGYIQWRNVGDAAWNNLVALTDITGPQGEAGDGSASLPSADGNTYLIVNGAWSKVSFTPDSY